MVAHKTTRLGATMSLHGFSPGVLKGELRDAQFEFRNSNEWTFQLLPLGSYATSSAHRVIIID
jgi:hypothetical protein